MLLPLLVLALPPRQARAQLTRLPAVAVLDFGVLAPGVRSTAILGRSATDAVVIEMTRSGRYDVTPRTQLNQQLQDLGLSQPLNNNGLQKLGQALGVDLIASGDVTNIGFTEKPRRAKVSVSVRLTDVVSGELVNGAIETGYSSIPPAGMQPDDESLINQAISDAAYNAIKTVNNYTLPEATVLLTTADEVSLNRGSRDGLQTGQEFVITRGKERVGKIQLSLVSATTSIGKVIDIGKGIKPEDRARAVFKLPGYNVDPNTGLIASTVPPVSTYKPSGKKGTPVLLTVLAIGAAVLLASFLFSQKSNLTNASGIGKIEARAFAEGSVTTPLDPSAARVQLTWQPAGDIPVNNVLEYHIFRDDQIIGVTARQQTTFIDFPAVGANPTFTQVTYNTISYTTTPNPFPGNPGGTTSGGTTTGGTTTGGTTTGGTTTGGTNTGGTNTGSNNGTTPGPEQPTNLSAITVNVPAMSVGVTHHYKINVLYRQVQAPVIANTGGGIGGGGVGGAAIGGGNVGGGTTTGTTGGTTGGTTTGGTNTGTNNGNNGQQILYRESQLRQSSGAVTPIPRPQAVGPTSDQDLRRVQVSFQSVPGADQYVFEFAQDPSFRNKVVRGPFFTQFTGSATTSSDVFDLSGDFKNLAAGGRVYFRVGARTSTDEPGPVALFTPNGGNYIYSANPISFSKLGTPPPPPG
jgi:hypothetical protein